MTANIPANKVPTKRATNGSVFLTISPITITGTKNNHPETLKEAEIAMSKSFVFTSPFTSTVSPNIINKISVKIYVGIVVNVMYLMCVNKSVPAIAGARFVVSDIGDNLSPKYAPDTTAPATIPKSKPNAPPIPIKAIPTVAEVVQELPVAIEITEHIINVAGKKMAGLKICKP